MTLVELIRKYSTDEQCRAHLEALRWPEGVRCPRCDHDKVTRLKKRAQFTCAKKDCRYRFSATSGTIFHASHIGLAKWFLALCLVTDMKKGTPSLQIHRELEVSKECAWHMVHRIREAMREDPVQGELFKGIVQMDEYYFGGMPRKGSPAPRGRGTSKQPLVGIYENETGSIRTAVVPNCTAKSLGDELAKVADMANVELHTDEFQSYRTLGRSCKSHSMCSHSTGEYVTFDGVHNNCVENAWSLFARAVMGSFHKISVKHLPRYLAEFDSRFNARGENGTYFHRVLRQSVGRRLTLRTLIDGENSVDGQGA